MARRTTLRGLNVRGKNRVREHGPEFTLLIKGDAGGPLVDSPGKIFVRSDDGWAGWFELGVEVA